MESLSIRSIDRNSLNYALPGLIERLSNLRRISLPNSKMMCYFQELIWQLGNPVGFPNEVGDFFSKVQQVTDWDISVDDLNDAARFMLMLPSNYTSLAIRLTSRNYFDRGDDFFLDILGECGYLESLVLSHVSRSPGIHEEYIHSHFPFRGTLTSLELSTPNDHLRPINLEFAHLFPNLRSLRLVSSGTINIGPMETPLTFHHLSNLELRNHALQHSDLVLSCLDLPAITRLSIEACSPSNNIGFPTEEVPRVMKSFRSHLERFGGTLRTLSLDLETRAYDKFLASVATRTGRTLFTVHPPISLDQPASLPSPSTISKQLLLDEEEEEEVDLPHLPGALLDDTQTMLRWMSERVEKMREIDDRRGAVEMWYSLREMRQLKTWLEG